MEEVRTMRLTCSGVSGDCWMLVLTGADLAGGVDGRSAIFVDAKGLRSS